jgi:hypothetical protein
LAVPVALPFRFQLRGLYGLALGNVGLHDSKDLLSGRASVG